MKNLIILVFFRWFLRDFMGASLVAQRLKRLPPMRGTRVWLIPGLGRSPGEGNGNPLQYSCLETPMDGGAWWATVHGLQRVGHNWVTSLTHSRDFINLLFCRIVLTAFVDTNSFLLPELNFTLVSIMSHLSKSYYLNECLKWLNDFKILPLINFQCLPGGTIQKWQYCFIFSSWWILVILLHNF